MGRRKKEEEKKEEARMGLHSCKPRGIQAARKLRNHRREERWADLKYKKKHLGTVFKFNPFGGSTMAKGIVVEKWVSKLSSLTLLFVSAAVYSSLRTVRKFLLS